MNNFISIVIRTFNEEKHLGEVLDSIKKQDYKNYEIIIVDSESTDGTIDIANKYNVKIISIKKKNFNYSYASNIGVSNTKGDLVCFLSGHSIPVEKTFLSDINKVFQNKRIGACYGDVIALPDGSITEKIFNRLGFIKNIIKNKKDIIFETAIHPGIFSCSNACARKSILLKHPFVEELGKGGEDVEFAYRVICDGYLVAKVPKLLVMHSHRSNLLKFLKEFKNWRKMYKDVVKYIELEGDQHRED